MREVIRILLAIGNPDLFTNQHLKIAQIREKRNEQAATSASARFI
jgi:hypothetical protein